MDPAQGEVSALRPVAVRDGKYQLCPYISCERIGDCLSYRIHGPRACYQCGWDFGAEVGYDYGNNDGREEQYHMDRLMKEANR